MASSLFCFCVAFLAFLDCSFRFISTLNIISSLDLRVVVEVVDIFAEEDSPSCFDSFLRGMQRQFVGKRDNGSFQRD